ncbi:MAG: putative lipopolysaccharide heptosyltransferase III [Betaproteobacteria bacterium]|jgi:heptosyltransferase-3|nr:putative lipopolysaccharide heptosyltransferase III [Betaproteobacteria bacterium]MBK7742546.1 putative lipopolysaccharide heptosyltransferase III [Betaproteobacteria bacterium]MBK8690568.1 putative lipopolysaccharide heptosyltransferase III [Betaproteobacteria bacterium]
MLAPAVADAIDLSRVRRVLVIKLRHHGDVLLASPVCTVLQRAAPQAEIDALVYRETLPMLAGHPAIRVLHAIDRAAKQRGLRAQLAAEWRLLRALRARRYDLVVHLTEHPRGAWLKLLLGAGAGVAPERERGGFWWRRAFAHRYPLPRATPRHTVETNLDALRRIGIWPEPRDKALVLVPGEAAQARVAALLAEHRLERRSFVVVHPGSRWLFKCWPAAATAAIIDRLAADGWAIVLTGAPDPAERALVAAVRAATRASVVDLVGELTLPELAALIGAARLFFGVDSAPMHMAAAMGTPTVALFGPSGDAEWGPWRVPHRVVASTAHCCRPCGNNGCGGSNHSDCLLTLPDVRVAAAIEDLLAETGSTSPQ